MRGVGRARRAGFGCRFAVAVDDHDRRPGTPTDQLASAAQPWPPRPALRLRPPGADERLQPASGVSFDARIVRVQPAPGGTVLVLRDRSGETCAYLPGARELTRHGVNPALLQPRAQVEIDGYAHLSNRRKVLIEQLAIHPRG
ncbi:MAG: hypothetical protein M3Y41_05815 [Pseudomonadota bacterium]|nr:hypothetical protein [Pseudomonadota bacterium]